MSNSNIWIGKHELPDEEKPRWLERSASFATIISVILALMTGLAGVAFATSNRLTILEEHDRTVQEKLRYYDSLVIQRTTQIAEMQNDLKWIRERMEKSEQRSEKGR